MKTFATLIGVDDLAEHLNDANWRIFDCTFDLTRPEAGERVYESGHLPNALYAHLERDLSGPISGKGCRHPLPDIERFAQWLGSMGVGNETQVIAYDNAGGATAVRLWWLLRWLGHENVALLDGGSPYWREAGYAMTTDVPPVTAAHFVAQRREGEVLDAEAVKSQSSQDGALLVDARSPERYRGESEPFDPVAGRIPGARSRFFQDNLRADGTFKPAPLLLDEFTAILGKRAANEVVHYCGSGVTACHNLFAMERAGLAGSRIYAGSWSDWCSDPSRPVATGH